MIISYWKNLKPFGLRLKTQKKKKNELDVLQVYNVRYIKARIRTKVYTNFRCLNMSEEVQNENILQPFLLVPCLFITSNYI